MNPFFKYLVKSAFPGLPSVSTAAVRATIVSKLMREAKIAGIDLGSARSALSTVRSFGSGLRTSTFNKIFKAVIKKPISITKQVGLKWKTRIPTSIIPESDYALDTKYVYKFKVDVFDKAQKKWSERWVSLGTDRNMTAQDAWKDFVDNHIDTARGAAATLYTQLVDLPSVTFEGVWKQWDWRR